MQNRPRFETYDRLSDSIDVHQVIHRHSLILCCNSTALNGSFISANPPAQSNLNRRFFGLGFGLDDVLTKNSTNASACRLAGEGNDSIFAIKASRLIIQLKLLLVWLQSGSYWQGVACSMVKNK